jgi:hypothetical protein
MERKKYKMMCKNVMTMNIIYKKNLLLMLVVINSSIIYCNATLKVKDDSVKCLLTMNQPSIILAPDDPNQWSAFNIALTQWRDQIRTQIKYDGTLYDRPDFKWISASFNCYFLMMYDQIFFDYNNYIVDSFIDNGFRQFGSIDIVVLWHSYPRIGLDERNQFDFYRDMPGGLEGIKKVVDALHAKGVRVFINYNPWDTGTRRESVSDIDALAMIVKNIGADGIFLDTMDKGSNQFRKVLDSMKLGVVLESELDLPVEEIDSHHMSWVQWSYDSSTPGILRNKWIEQRHMQHGISRWTRDKSKEIHTAWMNGSGIMIWENIFGQWVGWNKRDSHLLKVMSGIQQRYADLFSCGEWNPLVDKVNIPDIYASEWSNGCCVLWTLVNRSNVEVEGEFLNSELGHEYVYFDLIRGIEITPNIQSNTLYGKMGPRGIGCFVAYKKSDVPNDMKKFLTAQAEIHKENTYDITFPVILQKLKPVESTPLSGGMFENMIEIPPFYGEMPVVFNCREVGYYKSIEDEYINVGPPLFHHPVTMARQVNIGRYAIDSTPVTNEQFKKFMDETRYEPEYSENFLKHWINGNIPDGKEDHPVVYVCLEDARAYAKWAKKRLPKEEEWQLAAGGSKMQKYPWGNQLEEKKYNNNTDGNITSVYAFPEGKSPYGVWDMCGNVWEMTESEHSDGRNRFCILKGGSCYKAEGSDWYFDGGVQSTYFAAKQLLIYPGIDRCSTVGFRCVVDME